MIDLLFNLLLIGVSLLSLVCFVWVLGRIWLGFPERTADDLFVFLVPIDLDKAAELIDPGAESCLRKEYSPKQFRELQRKRIHQYLEMMRRMSRNAVILLEWVNREMERENPPAAGLAIKSLAMEVRLYTLVSWVKLYFWLLLRIDKCHILPTPSLSDLREIWGLRGIECYDALKTAAGGLFLEIGAGDLERLFHSL